VSAEAAATRGRLGFDRRVRVDDRLVTAIAIGGPVVLAIALTSWQLSTRSLWLDEGASIAIASQHGGALWRAIAHDGGNMLAYYLLLHAIIGAFGDAAAIIRLPSVIANAATAAIVGTLALRLFGGRRRVAATAALLTVVSLPIVFWGQDARGYAPMVTFAAGSFLALALVLDTPAGSPTPRGPLLAFGATLLGALYLGFDAIVIVPAQLLILLVARERARAVLVTVAAVAVLCIPLLVLAMRRGSSQLFWVSGLNLSVLGHTVATLTSAGYAPNFHHNPLTTLITVLTLAAAVVALAVAFTRRPPAWRLWLPASWLLAPSLLALLAALAGEPIELQRLSILLVPALSLLLAWALWELPLSVGPAWAAVAVVLGLRLVVLVPAYGVSPENWKAAASSVLASSPSTACVAFYPQDGRMPFDYYVRRAGAVPATQLTPVLPSAPWGAVIPYIEHYAAPSRRRLASIVAACPRLWLIAAHEGQPGGPPASQADYHRYRRLLAALERAYPHRRLRTFGYAAAVRVDLFSRS
jgi:uncharacterized membrane protein